MVRQSMQFSEAIELLIAAADEQAEDQLWNHQELRFALFHGDVALAARMDQIRFHGRKIYAKEDFYRKQLPKALGRPPVPKRVTG